MKLIFRKVADMAAPTDERGLKAWRKLKEGDLFWVETSRQRNLQHHRKFWAMCNFLAEHSSIENAEHIAGLLKLRTGHCDVVETAQGTERIPRSISFASMDQRAFEEFYEACLRVIVTDIMPGVRREDLKRELEAFLQ